MPRKNKDEANEYWAQYHKVKTWRMELTFSRENDADVIQALESTPNRTDYIRKLIRESQSK